MFCLFLFGQAREELGKNGAWSALIWKNASNIKWNAVVFFVFGGHFLCSFFRTKILRIPKSMPATPMGESYPLTWKIYFSCALQTRFVSLYKNLVAFPACSLNSLSWPINMLKTYFWCMCSLRMVKCKCLKIQSIDYSVQLSSSIQRKFWPMHNIRICWSVFFSGFPIHVKRLYTCCCCRSHSKTAEPRGGFSILSYLSSISQETQIIRSHSERCQQTDCPRSPDCWLEVVVSTRYTTTSEQRFIFPQTHGPYHKGIGVREGIVLGGRKKFSLKITICPETNFFSLIRMGPETSCISVPYTWIRYNGFVCNVNSSITLHFVRSRWHLLHAFQFAYDVISAITFFMQSPRGSVIGKFCSYVAY